MSCGGGERNQPSEAAINSAIPHGDTLQTIELSKADQVKLANAIGRQSKPIRFEQLKELMDTPQEILFIYNFWKLDCSECTQLNEKLQQMIDDSDYPIKLILVNLDFASQTTAVNTYIRAENIFCEVMQLEIPFDQKNWQQQLINAWDGKLPATLFLRKGEGIDLFYQYNFKPEELRAIVDPLLL